MAKTRKATAGEKIVRKHGPFVHRDTKVPLTKDIDALVRRAVRETWKARGEYSKAIADDTYGWGEICDVTRERIERKYRVKL